MNESDIKTDFVTQSLVERALDFVKKLHGADGGGHDFSHIERVMQNARIIMSDDPIGRSADRQFVLLCCALHDADDRKLIKPGGGEFDNTLAFCRANGISSALFGRIKDVVSKVSFSSNPDFDPDLSIEAKIVQDADRLDALGAVGIARAFAYGAVHGRPMYGSENGTTVSHFYEKLLLLPNLMNTRVAKDMAKRREKIMRDFLSELSEESGIDG